MSTNSNLSAIDAQCHEWAQRAVYVATVSSTDAAAGYCSALADRIIALRTQQAQQAQGGVL